LKRRKHPLRTTGTTVDTGDCHLYFRVILLVTQRAVVVGQRLGILSGALINFARQRPGARRSRIDFNRFACPIPGATQIARCQVHLTQPHL